MTAVVDTSVLIDHLRGHPSARALLRQRATAGRLLASVVTRTELLAGMREAERSSTLALLGVIEWVPVDEQLADFAGELARRFVRSHRGIGATDYIIAATALLHDAELLTHNVKHFPMIDRLEPPY